MFLWPVKWEPLTTDSTADCNGKCEVARGVTENVATRSQLEGFGAASPYL